MSNDDKDFETFLEGKHSLNQAYREASQEAGPDAPPKLRRSILAQADQHSTSKFHRWWMNTVNHLRQRPALVSALLLLVIAVPIIPQLIQEPAAPSATQASDDAFLKLESHIARDAAPANSESPAASLEEASPEPRKKAAPSKQALLADAKEQLTPHDWTDYTRLSGAQIKQAFSNVQDAVSTPGSEGFRVTNYWYSDGRYTSQWQSGYGSGTVSGRWFVEGDERCVQIETAKNNQTLKPQCGPIYQKDEYYYTSNPSGALLGIHSLSPLSGETQD